MVTKYETDRIDLTESDLNDNQKTKMKLLLRDYEDRFTSDLNKIGCTHLTELDIQLKPGTQPVRKRPYRTNFQDREIIKTELNRLLEANIIVESPPSIWSLPIVLVRKKYTSEKRMCIDMREANKHIELPMTHTPNIDDLLSDLGHRKCRFYCDVCEKFREYLYNGHKYQEISKPMSTITLSIMKEILLDGSTESMPMMDVMMISDLEMKQDVPIPYRIASVQSLRKNKDWQ